jgi:signal transduction histidine kinase
LDQIDVPLTGIAGGEQLQQALTKLKNQEDNRIEVKWPDDQVFNVSINQVHQAGTVVALDDITYLKELDDMKTQFVETVSHDLRNPLSVIVGFVQLLQFDTNLSDKAKNAINGIVEGTEQMQNLIDDLLDLARIEAGIAGEAEICNLLWITKEVLDSFEHHLNKKELSLTTELSKDLPKILGDEMRLSQVITNFVSNAIKYTPPGGQIEVKLSYKDDSVVFQVSDNGPGISLAGQAQLFQKFYRVPEIQSAVHVSGTGLGLSIVKAIGEAYGGRVWVKSQVGVGSTFGCSLPVTSDPVALLHLA